MYPSFCKKRIKKYKFDKKYIYLKVKDLNVIYDTKETARNYFSRDCIFNFVFADKEEYGASSSFYSYLKNEINKLLKNTNISK